VLDAAQETLTQMLAEDWSAEGVARAAEDVEAWVDELSAEVTERIPPKEPIACKAGCSFCCHLKVLVTAPEVIRLVAHLRATRSPDELDALRAHVAATDDKSRGMTTQQRMTARIPCPLLVDAKCSAYEARPLVCRGATSLDVGQCERGFDMGMDVEIPFYKPQYQVADVLRAAVSNVAFQHKLDGRILELIAALRIALDEPSAGKRWAQRLPAFKAARDAEFAEAMTRAMGQASSVGPKG